MGEVVRHNVVSVDGFVADEHDDLGPLFEWYFNGSVPLTDDGTCRVSQASAEDVKAAWASIGSSWWGGIRGVQVMHPRYRVRR